MAKTIRTKVYEFNELSSEAQQVAIKSNRDINFVCNDWWSAVYEGAKEDGVNITGFDTDRGAYCNIEFIKSEKDTAKYIYENHCEGCQTYKQSEKFLLSMSNLEASGFFREVEEYQREERRELYKKELALCYLRILRDEEDYLYSDEAVKETLIANDYYFTKDGKVFNY